MVKNAVLASGVLMAIAISGAQGANLRTHRSHRRHAMRSSGQSWIRIPDSGLVSLGCYSTDFENSGRREFLSPMSEHDQGVEARILTCEQRCFTSTFFMVQPDESNDRYICNCFSDALALSQRLSFNTCDMSDEVEKNGENLYFLLKGASSDGCLDSASAVQTRLVNNGENRAPEGYDPVLGAFTRLSPFELLRDGCSTNMYSIDTASMSSSTTLTSQTSTTSEFVDKHRDHVSSAIKAEASLGYGDFKATATAAADESLTTIFESSGSQSTESTVTESFGLERTALISMHGFESRSNFMTFSHGFHSALERYKDSGFDKRTGRILLRDYGMLFAEQAMYGGFFESTATMDKSQLEEKYESDEQMQACFELGASVEGKAFGFSASASASSKDCTEAQITEMQRLAETFQRETNTRTTFGMTNDDGQYVTSHQSAILVRDPKLYVHAASHEQLTLVPITELLEPKRISPIMFHKGMTEEDFANIKSNLESLVKETLAIITEVFTDADRLWYCIGGTRYIKTYDLENAKFERGCHMGITI